MQHLNLIDCIRRGEISIPMASRYLETSCKSGFPTSPSPTITTFFSGFTAFEPPTKRFASSKPTSVRQASPAPRRLHYLLDCELCVLAEALAYAVWMTGTREISSPSARLVRNFAVKAEISSTTRVCCSSVSCGNMGRETISAATRPATGKSRRL